MPDEFTQMIMSCSHFSRRDADNTNGSDSINFRGVSPVGRETPRRVEVIRLSRTIP
jgi:hypothetical protein